MNPGALLRAAIAKGKRIRKYYFGNLYGLTEVTADPKDWCVLQYHRPAEEDGMVVAFRRHESPYTGFTCALHEIDAEREYGVTVSSDYTPAPATTMTGTELRAVVLNTNKAPDSLLLEYRLLPQ